MADCNPCSPAQRVLAGRRACSRLCAAALCRCTRSSASSLQAPSSAARPPPSPGGLCAASASAARASRPAAAAASAPAPHASAAPHAASASPAALSKTCARGAGGICCPWVAGAGPRSQRRALGPHLNWSTGRSTSLHIAKRTGALYTRRSCQASAQTHVQACLHCLCRMTAAQGGRPQTRQSRARRAGRRAASTAHTRAAGKPAHTEIAMNCAPYSLQRRAAPGAAGHYLLLLSLPSNKKINK
jgi:hypothetical protein